MRFSTLFAGAVLAAAPAFVAAQQMVIVGQNGTLTYNPAQFNVAQGGTVQFVFMSKNHTVYQSSFTAPCTPMANGFQAPYFPIASDQTDNFPTITLQVTQTEPIWFYCAQTIGKNHCEAGMVGAINPTADKTFEAFQATAMGLAAGATNGTTVTNGTTTGTGTTAGNGTTAGTGTAAPVTPGGAAAGAAGGNGTAPAGNGALKSASSGLAVALALVAGSVFAL